MNEKRLFPQTFLLIKAFASWNWYLFSLCTFVMTMKCEWEAVFWWNSKFNANRKLKWKRWMGIRENSSERGKKCEGRNAIQNTFMTLFLPLIEVSIQNHPQPKAYALDFFLAVKSHFFHSPSAESHLHKYEKKFQGKLAMVWHQLNFIPFCCQNFSSPFTFFSVCEWNSH